MVLGRLKRTVADTGRYAFQQQFSHVTRRKLLAQSRIELARIDELQLETRDLTKGSQRRAGRASAERSTALRVLPRARMLLCAGISFQSKAQELQLRTSAKLQAEGTERQPAVSTRSLRAAYSRYKRLNFTKK